MLFWRSHRAARILFSLGFHLEKMTPDQAVDLLVERVGHERENARAEVRRSFAGDYGPLYQIAYMIGGLQFYATAGGGVFRETLAEATETNVGINVGGGIKMNLAGPLRLRLDYRVFTLRGGDVRHSKPQRFYAGLNLKF